ncbi:MAG: PAS domain S-box protein [Deltaproteobacteria bacterium]|nr:PAS domain S-box protein [Deltaproteobacteria bacterium]
MKLGREPEGGREVEADPQAGPSVRPVEDLLSLAAALSGASGAAIVLRRASGFEVIAQHGALPPGALDPRERPSQCTTHAIALAQPEVHAALLLVDVTRPDAPLEPLLRLLAAALDDSASRALAAVEVGVIVYGLDGRERDCNPAAQALLGLSREQLLGGAAVPAGWRSLRADGSAWADGHRPEQVAMRAGQPVRGFAVRVEQPGGVRRRLEASAAPLRRLDGTLDGAVVVLADATEREYLRAQVDTLARMLRDNPNPELRMGSDGRIIHANAAAAPLLARWNVKVGEQLASEVWSRLSALFFDEGLAVLEDVGDRLLWLSRSQPNAEGDFQVYAVDITDRARVEAEFRHLIDALPLGVVVHRAGQVLYVNTATGKVLGYTQGEMLGHNVLEVVHTEDRAVVLERMTLVQQKRVVAKPITERLVRKDGSVLEAEVTAMPVKWEDADAVLVVVRDLADQRQLEAKMVFADRMATLGVLASGVGHEINNPLAYIAANVEFALDLLRERPGDEAAEIVAALTEARQGSERVREIVQELRTFSREDVAQGTSALDEVLDLAMKMAANELRHRGRVERHLPSLPRVAGNPARLGQVFLNLLVNAAQSLPEDGAPDALVRVAARVDGAAVAVEISDTGVGIPAPVLARIFDPFFTTKPLGKGTGLGLSVCQSIVTALGGEITVQSTVGQGTTFRVSLPIAGEAAAAREPTTSAPRPRRRLRVLIIDDEPLVAAGFKRLLSAPCEVELQSEPREALAALEAGAAFDVVICDVMMPGLSGLDLYEALNRARPEAAGRLIFMTGGAFTPNAERRLATTGIPVLAKPFTLEQFLAAVSVLRVPVLDDVERPGTH